MAYNKQSANVGNLGDVAKHVAWTELCAALVNAVPASAPIVSLDFFAFRYTAPPGATASDSGFDAESVAKRLKLVEVHATEDAIKRYSAMQTESLQRTGEYLCSTALAVRVLGTARTRFHWAESHKETRGELLGAVRRQALPATVSTDAVLVENDVGPAGAVAALFDPFTFEYVGAKDKALWTSVGRALAKATNGPFGFLLCFRYGDSDGAWPDLDARGYGRAPTMFWNDGPFQLAVYATPQFASIAERHLRRLGWKAPWVRVGVDLAWSTGNTGFVASRSDSLEPMSPALLSRISQVETCVLDACEGAARAIVCIDAPLQCPQIASDGRQWEELFCSIGRRPVKTRWDKFVQSNGHTLRRRLEAEGFVDLAELDPSSLGIDRSPPPGRYFAEVYPNPAIRSFGGDTKYKQQDLEVSPRLLAKNMALLQKQTGRFTLPDPLTANSLGALKGIEDRFDSVVCHWIAALLTGEFHGMRAAPLFLIGGHGSEMEQGAIFSPLSIEDATLLQSTGSPLVVLLGAKCRANGEMSDDTAMAAQTETPEQSEAIHCEAPLVRVIARAGTGKTTVAIARAAEVLAQSGDHHVLMLTFSRRAAEEMRNRFVDQHPDLESRFEARTLHGLAHERLIASGQVKPEGLLNEFARDSVLGWMRVATKDSLNLSVGWADELTSDVNKTDPANKAPSNLLDGTGSKYVGAWKELLKLYEREHLHDFDSIMVAFEHQIRTDPAFARTAIGRATHLFVDEFQDTNCNQLATVRHLSGFGTESLRPLKQTLVVGDDFQSIYGFRGAVPSIFEAFGSWDAAITTTLKLTSSHRSTRAVIKSANRVGARLAQQPEHEQMVALVGHALTPARQVSGVVKSVGRDRLATNLREYLLQHPTMNKRTPTVCILAHKNQTVDEIVEFLRGDGVQVVRLSNKIDRSPGLRLLLALLTAWVSPGHRSFWAWWVLAREVGFSAKAFKTFWVLSKDEALSEVPNVLGQLGRAGEVLAALCLEEPTPSVGVVGSKGVQFIELLPKGEQDVCRNLLTSLSTAFPKNAAADQLLRHIGEMTRRDFAGASSEKVPIVATTIHQFKGLEAQLVVVIDDFVAVDRNAKQDVLRMDYVARTRARDDLWVVTTSPEVAKDYAVEEHEVRNDTRAAEQGICKTSETQGAEEDKMIGKWVKAGKSWLNSETGETSTEPPVEESVVGWKIVGKWMINEATGETKPAPVAVADAHKVASVGGVSAPAKQQTRSAQEGNDCPTEFEWKSERLSIPRPDAPIWQRAPNPNFAKWLANETWQLRGMPAVPPCGYSQAMNNAGVGSVMAVFGPLGAVQRWCKSNGLFDLSAIIVNKDRLEPGGGHFIAHTRDADEWRQYMRLALAAMEIAKGRRGND